MNAFTTVGYFLVTLVFNIVIFALWIRIGLRMMKFSALHPVGQLIYTITNPIVRPVQSLFGAKTAHPSLEIGTFIVLCLVEVLKFFLISLLFFTEVFPISYILIFTVADLIVQPINLLFYMILIRVIMSWLQPDWRHPLNEVICAFTNPLIRLGQSYIPVIAGFDFSPFVILVILKVISLFISSSLPIHII
jgi:YggT family protein